ncbi:hypothetical protein B0H13DRAFT_1999592 [Mycena leptocephala]|nr:hypothetical protein B0H13DRAFT_1999592 [Mycena leptocephala]
MPLVLRPKVIPVQRALALLVHVFLIRPFHHLVILLENSRFGFGREPFACPVDGLRCLPIVPPLCSKPRIAAPVLFLRSWGTVRTAGSSTSPNSCATQISLEGGRRWWRSAVHYPSRRVTAPCRGARHRPTRGVRAQGSSHVATLLHHLVLLLRLGEQLIRLRYAAAPHMARCRPPPCVGACSPMACSGCEPKFSWRGCADSDTRRRTLSSILLI